MRVPIDLDDRLEIQDRKSGDQIDEVLLIPVYMSRCAGYVAYHGPDWGSGGRTYIKRPMVYESGGDFVPYRPRIVALIWITIAATGDLRGLVGLGIVAPGYETAWVELDDLDAPARITLAPLEPVAAAQALDRLRDSLAENIAIPTETLGIEWAKHEMVRIRLNQHDRDLVLDYLERGAEYLAQKDASQRLLQH